MRDMSITMQPEELAQIFHETYEKLAPSYRYKTRKESAVEWDKVPENNKKLMIAVSKEVIKILNLLQPLSM